MNKLLETSMKPRKKFRIKAGRKIYIPPKASDYKSMVLSVDSCLSRKNIVNILKCLCLGTEDVSPYIKCLDMHLSNISNLTFLIDDNIEQYLRLYVDFVYGQFAGNILDEFIRHTNGTSQSSFFKVSYIQTVNEKNTARKNLIFSFDNNVFKQFTNIVEDWDVYESSFRHLFILLLILSIFKEVDGSLDMFDRLRMQYLLIRTVKKYAGMVILTNINVTTEFLMQSTYSELFNDIKNIPITSNNDLFLKTNTEKQIIEFEILNSYFLSEEYLRYLNAFTSSDIGKKIYTTLSDKPYIVKSSDVRHFKVDEYLDKKNISKVRLMKGDSDKSLLVHINLVGMRILSRVILQSADSADYLMADKLHESFYIPDDMTACLLWRLFSKLLNHSTENVIKTKYKAYSSFISKSNYKRQLVKKTSVAILLSQYDKKEQKRLIDKYFSINDTKQKAELRADIDKIKRITRRNTNAKPALIKLMEGAFENYVW